MVLHKRLDYGFSGYQVPAIPRASRSARGKRSFKKKAEEHVSPFDLLATVAGELLLLKENTLPPSTVPPGKSQFVPPKDTINRGNRGEENFLTKKCGDEEKPFKLDNCCQGSGIEGKSDTKVAFDMHAPHYILKDNFPVEDGAMSPPNCLKSKFDVLGSAACADKSINERKNDESTLRKRHTDTSSCISQFSSSKVYDTEKIQQEIEQHSTECMIHGAKPDFSSSFDLMELHVEPPVFVGSDSSIELPLCGDHITSGLCPKCEDDIKLVSRDDDEKSSGCAEPSISLKACRPSYLGDQKIKKMLVSKFWKYAPILLNDGEAFKSDLERKPDFHYMEPWYTRQRTQRSSHRRKLFERSSVLTSEGGISSEGTFTSPRKYNKGAVRSNGVEHGASRTSSPVVGHEQFFKSEGSHVKFRIKSFRVPELFIEIPKAATVGSLKRTVVDAASAILGGGLQISILLHGKKVRDDHKTLIETGITRDGKLDSLGFMLEPNLPNATSLCHDDHPHLLADKSQPLNGHSVVPPSDSVVSGVPIDPLANAGNCITSEHKLASDADKLSEKLTPNSGALVAIPSMNVEALVVVPLSQKSQRSGLAQRRIRRPFSVSEVEALVQAVEKVGTGRWRDVKLRAFENAKHRTYVDLKDKWKTLVHTARISPQQRRGEPVPQELLDRVLSAHAYWSQQQAKQLVKPQTDACLHL